MRGLGAENLVKFVKLSGRVTSTWPPNPASRSARDRVLTELLWWASFVNVIGLLVPLVLAVNHYRLELGTMMKSLSELTALSEVLFNLILCKFQRRRLQVLLLEVTSYVKNATNSEKRVMEKYVDRYSPFFMAVGCSYFMTAAAFSCGPLVMTTSLPADAWYPFSIEALPAARCLLYVLQVLAILQTGLCITVDFMVGTMLLYAAARLELLGAKLMSVATEPQLKPCIEEHQRLMAFVKELSHAVRYIVLKGNVTMAVAVICGAFPLIRHEPLVVVSQFILMVAAGLLRLYVSAWPADDLREMSERIASSIYASPWIEGTPQMRKTVLFVIRTSQRPLVISVAGIFSALTLEFYASFVSSTLSYFMTIRAVIGE